MSDKGKLMWYCSEASGKKKFLKNQLFPARGPLQEAALVILT